MRALGQERGYVIIQPTAPVDGFGLPSWDQGAHVPLVHAFVADEGAQRLTSRCGPRRSAFDRCPENSVAGVCIEPDSGLRLIEYLVRTVAIGRRLKNLGGKGLVHECLRESFVILDCKVATLVQASTAIWSASMPTPIA